MYKVYVKTDEIGNIVGINSDVFMKSFVGWTLIDEGDGDKYHHAQGHYFSKPLTTEAGAYQYKMVNEKVIDKSTNDLVFDIPQPDFIAPN